MTVFCPLHSVVNLLYPGGEVNSCLISIMKVTVEVKVVWAMQYYSIFMKQMESCFEIIAVVQAVSPTSCVFLDKSLHSFRGSLWEMRGLD